MKKIWMIFTILCIFCSANVYAAGYDALSKDMNDDFTSFAQDINAEYTNYVEEQNSSYDIFKRDIEEKWAHFKDSTVTDWVQYNDDFSARSSVNFKDGFAEFEALLYENTDRAKREALRNIQEQMRFVDEQCQENAGFGIINDPVELEQKTVVRLVPNSALPLDSGHVQAPEKLAPQTLTKEPDVVLPPDMSSRGLKLQDISPLYMKPIDMNPRDMAPQDITSPQKDTHIADVQESSLTQKERERTARKEQKEKAPYTMNVQVPLPSDYLQKAAAKYRNLVYSNGSRFGVKTNVIYAIIHTESYFNPFARSHVPAFGLMQLVPSSGGKDAYEYVFKKSVKPSADYLYDPNNNILLGTAYFSKVRDVYFQGVRDEESAYILSIAAYNTGIGNVAKAITGTKSLNDVVATVNTMTPSALCAVLLEKLPYDETKKYLEHILNRSAMYRGI